MTVAVTVAEAPPSAVVRPRLAALFADYARFVARVLRSRGVPQGEVEDALQEVFLVAHRRMEDWDPSRASARTWLFAIAIRVAANYHRLARVRYERPENVAANTADVTAAAAEPVDASVHRRRQVERLYEALGHLEPAKRDVFVLFELEGLRMKEIAEIVGSTPKAAYARLYAARREVALALGDEPGGGP